MKRLILQIALVLGALVSCVAQKYATSVILDTDDIQARHKAEIVTILQQKLKERPLQQIYYLYDKSGEQEYTKSALKEEATTTIPSIDVLYIDISYIENKHTLKAKTDTSGKVISLLYQAPIESSIRSKVVHVPSSERTSYIESPYSIKYEQNIKSYKEYYNGKQPNKFKPGNESYKLALSKVKKKYASDLAKFNTRQRELVAQGIYDHIATNTQIAGKKIFTITDQTTNEKGKVELLKTDATLASGLQKGDDVNAYEIITLEGYTAFDYISVGTISEINDSYAMIKPVALVRKKLLKALDEGKQVVFSNNPAAMTRTYGHKTGDKVMVVVAKSCKDCVTPLEKNVLGSPQLGLYDESLNWITDRIKRDYKDEKFIDSDMQALQSSAVGSSYIFKDTKEGVTVTEVETGQVIATSKYRSSAISIVPAVDQEFLDVCTKSFDEPVTIIKTSKIKKDKVKRLWAFSPYGFTAYKYNFVSVSKEIVGEKEIERLEVIATGYPATSGSSPHCSLMELAVNSGEKELLKLINEGADVQIRPFMGKGK